MPELHLRPQAEKDLRRIGPGPERARILAGLRRLGEDASNLDIKAIVGSPGWRRLRIGTYRVCYRSAPTIGTLAVARLDRAQSATLPPVLVIGAGVNGPSADFDVRSVPT